MLQLIDLSKKYRKNGHDVIALQDANVHVSAGEMVTVRGPSGSGKSTLLLAAGVLLKPDAGQVLIDGTEPYRLSSDGRARFRVEHIGFVFQQFHLLPYLNVLDNIAAPALATRSIRRADAMQRAEALLEQFGLSDRRTHLPGELSTGQCQRVALARALLCQPQLLLADEPTGNLDPENGRVVLEELSTFAKSGGAVLVVTHDDRAAAFATRQLTLNEGTIEQEASVS